MEDRAEKEKWSSVCVFPFTIKQLLLANLAFAPVSRREVIDVCSIQKACWETVTDLRQAPWTSRLTPRTWPNAFRNSQMAAVEGYTVPNVYTSMFVYVFLCLSRIQESVHVCKDKVREADLKCCRYI